MCPAISMDMLSPPPTIPNSSVYHTGLDDSGPYSTRSRSGTTSTGDCGQVELRGYFDSPHSSPCLTSQSSSTVSSSSSYLSPLSSRYLSTPTTAFSPFSGLSPDIPDAEWSDQDVRIRESPEPPYRCSQSGSDLSSAIAMSTSALSYDAVFSMSDKEHFTWPGMMPGSTDDGANYLGHDLSSLGSAGSDAGYASTAGSRSSMNGSPPVHPMTAEQRDSRRHMEQLRRENKSATRFRRSESIPYMAEAAGPSSAGLNLPAVYTSATAPISLLAEPVASVPSQSYLSHYNHHQPLQDPNSAGMSDVPIYAMQHQVMPAAYNVPLDFTQGYQQPNPSYGHRPARPASTSVTSDHSHHLYPIPGMTNAVANPVDPNHVRVVQGRPKPQCWEHGCNGRQFSTFSNLLRHQREKSGQATKASCPSCGAEFTRTTARNGHLLQGKCRKRGESEEGEKAAAETPEEAPLAEEEGV